MKEFLKNLGVVLWIAAQIWLLHFAIGWRFGPNNSVLGFYARDITTPLLLGAFLYLHLLRRETGLTLTWQPAIAALNCLWVGASLVFLFSFERVYRVLPAEAAIAVLFALLVGAFVTSALCFVSPAALRAAVGRQGTRVGYALAGVFALVIYARAVDYCERPLAYVTGTTVQALYSALGSSLSLVVAPPFFLLRHASFYVRFATGCAGFEGIFFFLLIFGLHRAFETDRRGGPAAEIPFVLAGVVYMFGVNVIRIAMFFAIGIFLSQRESRESGIAFFNWVAHANVGWLLFFPAIPFWFRLRNRFLARQRA